MLISMFRHCTQHDFTSLPNDTDCKLRKYLSSRKCLVKAGMKLYLFSNVSLIRKSSNATFTVYNNVTHFLIDCRKREEDG